MLFLLWLYRSQPPTVAKLYQHCIQNYLEKLFLTLEKWSVGDIFYVSIKIFFQMKNKVHTIAYIKRQAKTIKKKDGITHTQALDSISKEHGYSNWKHYSSILNQQPLPNAKVAKEPFHITFTDWLRGHKNRNSPLGDLASDMVRDKTWPLYDKLKDYENYLNFHNATLDAIEALKRAWRTYGAYLKRKNASISNTSKLVKHMTKKYDSRKIVIVKKKASRHYLNRTVEKFNPWDKAWISWDGRKAIPVTVLEVDDKHYTFRIERPIQKSGNTHYLFLDEVWSTPELACMNYVTL